MKVLMVNGSPRRDGNTSLALAEMEKVFQQEGIQVEIVSLGTQDIRGMTWSTRQPPSCSKRMAW